MPKQRVQVKSGFGSEQLIPAASPVDTFVQTSEGQQLEQLARGLSQLSPALGRLSTTLAQRQAEADFAAGEKKARELAESAKGFKEAIRKGLITPDQSPWFMAGLREQFGRLSADRMNFEFLTAAAQDEKMQTTTKREDFDQFYTTFIGQWQEDNLEEGDRDEHFEKGFGARADAYLADAQRQFAAQLSGRVIKVAGDQHFSEVMNSVLTEQGRGVTPEVLGASLTMLNDLAVSRGTGGELVNQRTVDAVVAAARRLNDPSLLGVLDHVQSGPAKNGKRAALSTTKYGAAAAEEAENDIAAENQSRNNRAWQETERTKNQAVDGVLIGVMSALEGSTDPRNVDLKDLRVRMLAVAPEKVPLLYQLQEAWSDRTLQDDPLQVASAFRRVWTPRAGEGYTSLEDAAALLANRDISQPTYRQLVSDIRQRDEAGGSTFEKDQLFTQGRRQVRAMFVSEFGFEGPDMRRRAEEAVDEFSMRYIRWRTGEGKEARETEARQWIHDARLEVFRGKAGATDVRDFDKIPNANLGPQTPDFTKQLVTDPSNISLLEGEAEQIGQRVRNGFSSQAISVLQYAGVEPTMEAVLDFIKAQRAFAPSFVPPDDNQ